MAEKKPKKASVVKMEFHTLVREEVALVSAVPENILLTFARFWGRWSALPPLVRAGASFGLLNYIREKVAQSTNIAKFAETNCLTRRQAVHTMFVEADDVLGQLLTHLVRSADREAEARGIDADIR